MESKISVVINTLNEEKAVRRVVESVKWANEVLICDMFSEDKTVEIARKSGAKVILHKKVNYVEKVRNFAISKALNEWILVLDPDEEIPESLKDRLIKIASRGQVDYVRIPRKNIIFGRFMRGAMWWPDYNIRFFKKGSVQWTDEIHRPPETKGVCLDLPAEEEFAVIHHNYQTLDQFIERMNRYTTVEAKALLEQGYQFNWRDLIEKPLSEFLSRFFATKGYQDGLHGLALSLLQAFSFLCVYLKIWQEIKFKEDDIELKEIEKEKIKVGSQINYWIDKSQSKNIFKNFLSKLQI